MAFLGARPTEKYRNEKSICALGFSHRSKLESSVCQILQLREKAGDMKLLQHEDHVYLTKARIRYVPDFRCQCLKTGLEFWVEAKGFATPEWILKRKLWRFYGPGKLEIWTGSHINPKLTETIHLEE